MRTVRPRCPSVGPEGYRCRRRLHDPVTEEAANDLAACHTAVGWPGQMFWDDATQMESPRQEVSFGDGDIVWDVARLIALARATVPQDVPVAEHVDPDAVNRFDSYWRSVDVHTPIILAPHPTHGYPVVLDGRHRLYKAWKTGREYVPGVLLTRAEERAARVQAQ